MKWQAVFWDFDGVVLDSVDVKTRAFARMFSAYGPDIEKAVVDYHLDHGGVSRYDKFRHYYTMLLHKPVNEDELQALGDKFSDLALDEVLKTPFIPGALETLDELLNRGIPAFVVSGTPEEEVRHIVQMRQLSKYFVEVHGSPRNKVVIINDILTKNGYDASECLFLGDAMTDYDAAIATGICFCGVSTNLNFNCFPEGTKVLRSIDIREWTF